MSRIGRLTATIAVPRQGELPLGALDRIGTAITERVPAALTRRLAPAPDRLGVTADRPVVLIRRLQVTVPVPATAGADEIAERLADRLGRAILMAPDEGRVRYPSRAAHIAAFAAALAGGTGDGWVFASFDGVRLLAPVTALRTLAERYGIPVVAVLAALHDTGDLPGVLEGATPNELTRTWAACLAVPHVRRSQAEAMELLGGDDPVEDVRWQARRSTEALALLLAARLVARGQPAGVAVAVASTLAAAGVVHHASPVRRTQDAEPGVTASGPAASAARAGGPAVWEADGAPAFLVLPSFAKVGLHELTPAQRTLVLAVATRTAPDDPAVVMAAGLGDDDQPSEPGHAITPVVQQSLMLDGRLGAERVVTLRSGPHVVVADASSGIWLAILADGEPVDSALVPALAGLPRTRIDPDDALTARVVADLRYLLPGDADASAREVAVAARAGLGHFARRLPGFGASSLPYVSSRFLTPGGTVADLGESIWVRLPSPPLLVVLALAGLDRTTVTVPWLEPVVTVTHEDVR